MFQRRLGSSVVIALACGFMLGAVQVASAQNVLLNPGFEVFHDDFGPRPTGWGYWDNVYDVDDTDNGVAYAGARKMKMFGNWGWPWNVAGIVQEFDAYAGDVWELDVYSMNSSVDPIQGQNYMVMKIEYFDAGHSSIGFSEATILDVNSPQDTWIDNAPIQAVAPAGTAKVQALFLFLQPNFENGAGNIDDASFVLVSRDIPTVSEWGLIVMTLVGLAGGTMLFRRLSVA